MTNLVTYQSIDMIKSERGRKTIPENYFMYNIARNIIGSGILYVGCPFNLAFEVDIHKVDQIIYLANRDPDVKKYHQSIQDVLWYIYHLPDTQEINYYFVPYFNDIKVSYNEFTSHPLFPSQNSSE
jgi:hypothetical protein